MTTVSTCVICDGQIQRLRQALVAPFLARRIWDRQPFCVDVVECESCGFMFYNPRLDDAEERRLYGGYRSEEYQQMRYASEPWYTEAFNADLAEANYYENRRRGLAEILRQHLGNRQIKRVLDYGGDRGDLVQGLIGGAEAYVYDISGIPAAEGVTATRDPAACGADLIINSNVLEHVGFPRRLVGEIVKAAPAGGLIFMEVPSESPFGFSRIARRLAQIGIMCLTRPRLARSIVRPATLYMMHEHINYFSNQSLTALMGSCGCGIVASGSYGATARSGKGSMAWCLAKAA